MASFKSELKDQSVVQKKMPPPLVSLGSTNPPPLMEIGRSSKGPPPLASLDVPLTIDTKKGASSPLPKTKETSSSEEESSAEANDKMDSKLDNATTVKEE